ncbi:MAG: hypothetical protein QOG43_2120 [Actinomycetota bacterium]|jgi:uncharacterized protein (DUF58 family)|nr:hypothetical protein [Actinomycetota bacterium]
MARPPAAAPTRAPTTVPTSAGRRPQEVLRQLELIVTRRLDGLLQGDYLGLVPGHGTEPGETRVYVEGDDVRRIDWNVTARTTVPHVRDAIADRELETWALVDCSASLDFGTALCEKRDLALAAVAAVGFLTARTGNRMGAVIVRPDGMSRVPARPGRQALLGLLHTLATRSRVEGGGPTDLIAALESLVRPPRRRGLTVVVSDFLAPPGWERPLRALCSRHQVLCIEVVDPRELELPNVGYLTLVDPETGALREVQTANESLRRRYAEAAAAQRAGIARSIRGAGASHLVLRTDRDWLRDIVGFVLMSRRKRDALSRAAVKR